MTGITFYAVVRKDKKSKAFVAAAHNLTSENATEKVFELNRRNIAAQIWRQASFHDGELDGCELCQEAAQDLTEQDQRKSFWKKF